MKGIIKIGLSLLIINCSLFINNTIAQISINETGNNPDASSILDVSSTDKGILIPRMTTAERTNISNPATGLIVYDNDENSFWYYNGSAWTAVGQSIFTSENGLTHSNNNSDDFVFGADSMNWASGNEYKFFFNKGNGAFRAGEVSTISWDTDTVGAASVAFGTDNVAFGTNTTAFGLENAAIARNSFVAGRENTTYGNISTAIGQGLETQSKNEVAIGSYNTTYTPNSSSGFDNDDRLFIVGNGQGDNNRSDAMVIYKSGNTAINGALTLNNAFTFPTTDGSANQFLKTDGNGTLSWSDINLTSDNILDSDGDTKIQVEESSDEDIIRFDLDGTEYLRLEKGRIETVNTGNSVFIGEGAGENDDYSANNNVFMGYQSGSTNTTGYNNVFIGYQSGQDNTIGINNVFLGYRSGKNNTMGTGNLLLGYQSGYKNTTGNYNTFLGDRSGYNNTTGSANLFLGFYTGYYNTTGHSNIFIGHESGRQNTEGESNIYIGKQSGYSNTTGDKNVFLGYESGRQNTEGESNICIGEQSGYSNTTGDKNVFLGYQAGYNETGSDKLYIDNSNTSSPLIYGDFDENELVFNGSVGVGTSPTKAKFQVQGSGSSQSFTSQHGVLNTNGAGTSSSNTSGLSIYASSKVAANGYVAFSDVRIKNIKSISNSENDLETLMNIQITDYTMKDTIVKGNQAIKKVIAQQVAEIYPQAVNNNLIDVIPNIYQSATMDEKGWITGCEFRDASSELKQGDRVQIIFEKGEEILEVLEIKGNAFKIKPITNHQSPITIFVYGKEVNDFHTVDYEAISMLNVSATQQLAKEVEELKAENERLKKDKITHNKRFQQLEQQNAEMKVMLEQIQAQLSNQ